jgi:hypothetical protein
LKRESRETMLTEVWKSGQEHGPKLMSNTFSFAVHIA